MERLGETKKRKKEAGVDEFKEKKTRKTTGSAVEYLREKAQMEQSLRQEELAVRKKDQELQTQLQQQQQLQPQQMIQLVQTQNQRMQTLQEQALEQQQQQNQMLVALLQRMIPK